MALSAGERLGPYEIVELVGAGGMGEVYRARDARLNRDVAVKILPPQYSGDEERIRRFEQEAKSTGMLNHPNIISIYDVGSTGDAVYVVTELLSGETLRERLGGSGLPLRKVIDYGLQLAHGLAAAHEKGIVHRDLKPENIFVTRDGRLKILDFGLAKLVAPEKGSLSVLQTIDPGTRPGVVLGTVGYMSPEQVRGREVDHRSDIFSCGAILYEMLTGKRAFHRDSTADTLSAILKEDPAPPAQSGAVLPPALERIIRHCLEKNPEERFQSARDLAFDLEMVSGISQTTPAEAVTLHSSRMAWKKVAMAMTLLAVIAGSFFLGRWSAIPAAVSKQGALNSDSAYTRLTFQRGFISSARFTPDGQSVLFSAAWGARRQEIFTTRPQNPVSRSLGIVDAVILAVSKNNEMAVLLNPRYSVGWQTTGTLARCPIDGGAPRQILNDVQDADWSADGANLAIARQVPGAYVLEFPIGKELYRTNGWLSNVRISPSMDRIAFLKHDEPGDDRGSVAVVDLNGKLDVLTSDFASSTGLHWSPDGSEIWFTASKGGSNEQPVYAVNLKKELRVIAAMLGNLVLQDIYPDGKVLLIRDNRRREMFVRTPADDREREFSWLDWSFPRGLTDDGKWVAFEEQGVGGGPNYSVYMRNTDGSPAIQLGSGFAGRITPDGKYVLAQLPSEPSKCTLLPTGVGSSRSFTVKGAAIGYGNTTWFRDSVRLLAPFTGEDRTRTWSIVDTRTGAATPVAPATPSALITPGEESVLTMQQDGSASFFSLDGKEMKSVKLQPGILLKYCDDGVHVFIGQAAAPAFRILKVSTVTGESELWREIIPPDISGIAGGLSAQITPDGGTYVYTFRRVLSDLYMASNMR